MWFMMENKIQTSFSFVLTRIMIEISVKLYYSYGIYDNIGFSLLVFLLKRMKLGLIFF